MLGEFCRKKVGVVGKCVALAVGLVGLTGLLACKTTGWGQVKPTMDEMRILGGARIRTLRTFVDPSMFCGVFEVDNRQGEAKVYINPHRIQFVGKQLGKKKFLGTWSMKRTMVAREPAFRSMVREYHKLGKTERVDYWGKYYFPVGNIKPKQRASGFICFQLARSEEDPERIVLTDRSRMRLMGVLVGGGVTPLGWYYFEPMK
ncbi:MAG: hypothetical protein H6728_08690 [Myxococcales bacterium]|nr:hypothetical protein [Myxococcales bacterium]